MLTPQPCCVPTPIHPHSTTLRHQHAHQHENPQVLHQVSRHHRVRDGGVGQQAGRIHGLSTTGQVGLWVRVKPG